MDSARLKQRGNDFFKAGRLEDALKCYSDALELTSTDHLLLSNRSLVLCKLGRYAEALSDAEKCIQVSPKWAKGYLRKAVALIHIGKYKDAEKSCECGYRLQHDKRLSQDLVSQWLVARKQQMQPLVGNCFFELPTGTQILSEKYYVVLLKVIQARLSAAGGMSNLDMGHCLLAGFEELRDTLSNFGVKDASPMENWINALYTELDPQSTMVSAEHHSFVMKKTHEFIQWLNLLDTVLHCIIRPLVALAFLVISMRCWVLQCADAGAHYVALLTEVCFPLFEDSLLNTTEYIGYHVGTLSGYLGSFIGRSPSFTEAEAPILNSYCEKLKVLLTKYPPTQMEYEDVKSIALHNLSILESMLKAHDSADAPSSDVLAEEGVISGETARRLARQRPKEVNAYIQKLTQEYESKATQSTTADDAKNLIASAGDKAILTFVLNLQSPRLLHFSTHGVCDDQEWYAYHGNFWSLNKTALMLAGVNTYLAGEPRKLHKDAGVGMLTGLALSGMNLRETNLVFLSSCVSGIGNTPIQESVVSLALCARAAGSSTVIGTLWPILDTTAVKFSSLFYSKLCSAPGIRPSDAIATVKQRMRQDGDHWYNWAAYVCFGCDEPFLNTVPML